MKWLLAELAKNKQRRAGIPERRPFAELCLMYLPAPCLTEAAEWRWGSPGTQGLLREGIFENLGPSGRWELQGKVKESILEGWASDPQTSVAFVCIFTDVCIWEATWGKELLPGTRPSPRRFRHITRPCKREHSCQFWGVDTFKGFSSVMGQK